MRRKSKEERGGKVNRALVAINPATNGLLDAWLDQNPAFAKGKAMELLVDFFNAAPSSFKLVMLNVPPEDRADEIIAAAQAYVTEIVRRRMKPRNPLPLLGETPEPTDTGGRQMPQPQRGPRPKGH